MSDSRLRAVANDEIDNFSVSVLGYDREHPREGQRTPGEVLRESEDRMRAAKERREATKKYLGTVIAALTVAILTAAASGYWPTIRIWLGM